MNITTPGDYKLRNGDRATVLYVAPQDLEQPVFGYIHTPEIVGQIEEYTWGRDGTFMNDGPVKWDIVAPWPKEEWRPWTLDEIPLGRIVRNKNSPEELMIIAKRDGSVVLGGYGAVSARDLYNNYEYRIDTIGLLGSNYLWAPCRNAV